MKKIGMVGGFAAHNIGDDLCYDVFTEELSKYGEYEFTKLTFSVNKSTRNYVSLKDCSPDIFSNFDVIVWGPGGIFPGVVTAIPKWGIKMAGVPHIGVSCGYFPGNTPEEVITRFIGNNFHFMWCRDRYMLQFCNNAEVYGIEAPDCAYGKDLTSSRSLIVNREKVVIAPKAIQTLEVTRVLGNVINKLGDAGKSTVLIPTSAVAGEMDIIVCNDLFREADSLLVEGVLSYDDVIDIVRDAELVITLRKHTAVIAQMLGVPSIVWDCWGAMEPLQEVSSGFSKIVNPLSLTDIDDGADLLPEGWKYTIDNNRIAVLGAIKTAAEIINDL
jgi:hypothetical protein